MSRVRSRSDNADCKLYCRPNGGEPLYKGTVPFDVGSVTTSYRSRSVMTDNLTPDRAPRRSLQCQHQTLIGARQTGDPLMWSYVNRPSCEFWLPDVRITSSSVPSVPPPDWGGLVAQLVSQLDGGIQEGTLLGVSLMELGKTVAMMRNPFNLMRTDWRRVVKSLTPRELAKSSANLWLEHRYGWNAVYHDIKSFAKTYGRVAASFNYDALQHMTERYTAVQQETLTSLPAQYYNCTASSWNSIQADWYYKSGASYYWKLQPTSATVTNRVTCRQYRHQLRPLALLEKRMHAFGLSSRDILTTLWEVCPYSFVVDWFIDLQKLGPGFEINRKRLGQMDIQDCCYSTRVTQEIDASLCLGRVLLYYFAPWNGRMPIAWSSTKIDFTGGRMTTYTRMPGIPSEGNLWENCSTRGLSITQGISGVSLLLQRLLK